MSSMATSTPRQGRLLQKAKNVILKHHYRPRGLLLFLNKLLFFSCFSVGDDDMDPCNKW